MDQNPTKESRPPINLRIKFRSENVEQFIERYAVDVSRGGIFIRTREPLAVGTQLKLDFQFQNGSALMSGDGTVVWIREFDPNRTTVPPGMGVRFDKLSPDSQGVLEQLLVEKAKRERGGVPGSGGQAGGGIAVRRPSSMFSALEPQVSVAEGVASDKPAGAAATPTAGTNPPAATGPSLVEKLAAKSGGAKPESKSDSPYRPLGTAKNPFSGTPAPTPIQTSPADAPASSGGGPRPLSDLLPLFAGGVKTSPATAAPTRTDPPPADADASFDDHDEEPTQIAGRLPSFLTSDDDATTEVPADLAQSVKTAPPLPADFLPGTSPDSQRPGAARAKQSLDEAPPKTETKTATETAAPAASVDAGNAQGTADSAAKTDAAQAPAEGTTTAKPGVPAARKRSAAPVVVAVVVLGASAIFLYRFFGSHATENVVSAPSPAGVPSVATGEPAAPPAPPTAGPAAEPTPPAAPAAAAPAAPAPAEPPVAAPAKPSIEAKPDESGTEGAPIKNSASKSSGKKKAKAAAVIEPVADAVAPAAGAGSAVAAPADATDAAVIHQIKVTSKPVGADVSLDGQNVGKTPFSIGIADISAPHSIAVRKDGFEPFEQMIGPSSAWSKGKASKGKPGLSVLKLNARLKPIGGTAPAEGKGTIEPPPADDGTAKGDAPKIDRPLPPTDQPSEAQ